MPPDYFSATGQRWGNPLYRWSAHAATATPGGWSACAARFELVDIVRIDHFRGFAAYWEIPASEPTAVNGRWVPGPGEALFKAIAKALGPLPIIAEDLGVITPDVDGAAQEASASPACASCSSPSAATRPTAYLPHNHEPDTVVYTGTHDNDTAPGWWATRRRPRAPLRARLPGAPTATTCPGP